MDQLSHADVHRARQTRVPFLANSALVQPKISNSWVPVINLWQIKIKKILERFICWKVRNSVASPFSGRRWRWSIGFSWLSILFLSDVIYCRQSEKHQRQGPTESALDSDSWNSSWAGKLMNLVMVFQNKWRRKREWRTVFGVEEIRPFGNGLGFLNFVMNCSFDASEVTLFRVSVPIFPGRVTGVSERVERVDRVDPGFVVFRGRRAAGFRFYSVYWVLQNYEIDSLGHWMFLCEFSLCVFLLACFCLLTIVINLSFTGYCRVWKTY